MLEGSALRDIDMRRYMIEEAINNANISNAKNPRRAARNGYKAIDKSESKIIDRRGNKNVHRPNVEMLNKLNEMFGQKGGESTNG